MERCVCASDDGIGRRSASKSRAKTSSGDGRRDIDRAPLTRSCARYRRDTGPSGRSSRVRWVDEPISSAWDGGGDTWIRT